MKTLCQCVSCEQELEENDFFAFDLKGNPVCESCEQSAWQYKNTIVSVHGNDKNIYDWCEEFGFRNRETYDEDSPSGVEGFEYVSSSAWRGYWNVIIAEGYKSIASGWSTGDYSDVPWKKAFHELTTAISDGNAEPPVELIFSFGQTSNVFSTTTDIILKESDIERFAHWVEYRIGVSIDDLKNSLK
jgi:hypothetical protein